MVLIKCIKEEARNGVADMTIDESSDFQVFLIKKPIGVSLEDLEALKWSNDEEVLTKTKLKTGESILLRKIYEKFFRIRSFPSYCCAKVEKGADGAYSGVQGAGRS